MKELLFRKRHYDTAESATQTETELRPRGNRHRDGQIGRCCRGGGSPMLLALQTPMYPPGNVIHIVRSHPKDARLV